MHENESITLADGRTLSYAIYGSPVPRTTIVYMHGFPSSRFEGKFWHSACTKHGIRLIAADRPGNGLSSFQKDRCMLDWPRDVIALADELKISQFYALGVSGGAPYALACIKSISKERLLGVAIVSGLYPVKYGTAGMLMQSRVTLWLAPWMTGLTSFFLDSSMGNAARNDDPTVFENLMSMKVDSQHDGDQKVMKDPLNWPIFVAMARGSFAKSGEGASWEARLNGSKWGFELGDLLLGENGIALTLWHGDEDVHCPVGQATKAHEAMAGSVLHLKKGDGHVSFMFRDIEEMLCDLVNEREIEEYMEVGM
ncbi:alpha/beta-hydrolase [Ophiobolus disseminans]|uniref:Alpha/beta-hydrolase n=1 Tax=Ophiobolus disseminans TaxID=1469910 RepID=A0A6A6ZFS6_9PLEO|nr:alpha/beta-hydrolase [Ophiobolus disseminans]